MSTSAGCVPGRVHAAPAPPDSMEWRRHAVLAVCPSQVCTNVGACKPAGMVVSTLRKQTPCGACQAIAQVSASHRPFRLRRCARPSLTRACTHGHRT